jgi:hypothetical protein
VYIISRFCAKIINAILINAMVTSKEEKEKNNE